MVHALHALWHRQSVVTQLTIRRRSRTVIDRLKQRASAAGHSMAEEARQILSQTVLKDQLARQRAWLQEMEATRRELFGDRVFPDSSGLFSELRDERTRQIEEWALRKTEALR
jgi:plasmid stability protein